MGFTMTVKRNTSREETVKISRFDGALEGLGKLNVGVDATLEYEPGKKVEDIAFFMEFGFLNVKTGSFVPPRPFFRNNMALMEETYRLEFQKGARKIWAGELDPELVYADLGDMVVEDLRTSVEDFTTPNNAPDTVINKGFDNPLVESGLLMDSFVWEITTGDN